MITRRRLLTLAAAGAIGLAIPSVLLHAAPRKKAIPRAVFLDARDAKLDPILFRTLLNMLEMQNGKDFIKGKHFVWALGLKQYVELHLAVAAANPELNVEQLMSGKLDVRVSGLRLRLEDGIPDDTIYLYRDDGSKTGEIVGTIFHIKAIRRDA